MDTAHPKIRKRNRLLTLKQRASSARVLPVVMIADLIAAGLQEGWRVLRRPATPETCGHDIEVPDIELN